MQDTNHQCYMSRQGVSCQSRGSAGCLCMLLLNLAGLSQRLEVTHCRAVQQQLRNAVYSLSTPRSCWPGRGEPARCFRPFCWRHLCDALRRPDVAERCSLNLTPACMHAGLRARPMEAGPGTALALCDGPIGRASAFQLLGAEGRAALEDYMTRPQGRSGSRSSYSSVGSVQHGRVTRDITSSLQIGSSWPSW